MNRLSQARLLLFTCMLAMCGCTTLREPISDRYAGAGPALRSCATWLDDLDAAVDAAGVRNAQPSRVPGFQWLRLDRFTGSFVKASAHDAALFDAWTARARSLDRDARTVEIGNLPDSALHGLGPETRPEAEQRTEECAARLEQHDLADPEIRARLIESAVVPGDYRTLSRAVGLYPLSRIPFARGVRNWHENAVEEFRRFGREGAPASAVLYVPAATQVLSPDRVAALIARGRTRPLGIPEMSAGERAALLGTFAPVLTVETTREYDRIGALAWGPGDVPEVRPARPVIYGRVTFTRYGEAVLPQLVYTAWFSERPADSAFDVLAGKLDGIVFRVTLDPDGHPLVYDSIHPCGCYHMFFPTPRVAALPSPEPGDEWAFSPASAPVIGAGGRIEVYAATRTHYLSGIGVYAGTDNGMERIEYSIEDHDVLLALPRPEGGTRSIYGPDGLVAGTERPERLLFWPMGIASAGTMRQPGGRATAFLGKRHFDDADLIERRFRIVEP